MFFAAKAGWMTTEGANDFRSQAWEFLAKSRQYLAEG